MYYKQDFERVAQSMHMDAFSKEFRDIMDYALTFAAIYAPYDEGGAAHHPLEWRPMASAPKDGRDLLFYNPQYGGEMVVSFLYPDGDMGHRHTAAQFTHWMPLPQPPKEAL